VYVNTYFSLDSEYLARLARLTPKFGYQGFGEIVFYRTYSRLKADGSQENWHDVVVRVINGTMSIRKDWYQRNYIKWDEDYWQQYAYNMAVSLFKMYWMPAGRGLWAMGTQFVYDRGSMALNNCGFTKLGGNSRLSDDLHWLMDALMLGVGVGFEPIRDDLKVYKPVGEFQHYVADSREGWADSWRMLIDAYTKPGLRKPKFKFDLVRGKGQPIRGFGGLSSGPEPLKRLFEQTEELFNTPKIDVVRLKTDLANYCGCCVVAGNVRRSAELSKGQVTDKVFLDLKDYELHPDREDFGWMSNNTVALEDDIDFESLGEVARRVVTRGEPGIMNLRNFKYGRIGKPTPVREDKADGLNPCGEIPLEDKELCNVVETLPTQCETVEDWYKACEYASFYASCVSLLPTHREETNRVVVRNRRIGVSIIDWTGWVQEKGLHKVTSYMRKGYDVVTETNRTSNAEAGVPEAIRKTTIKPGGTTPKLPGKTPGIGYPTFKETLRRMRVAMNNPICPVLDNANIPYTDDFFDPINTRIYEYPTMQGPTPPADEVSLWEQAWNLVTVQREWADNAVSNTLYFRPRWKLVMFRDTFVRDWSDPKKVEAERERQFREEFPKYAAQALADHAFKHLDNEFAEVGKVFTETEWWKFKTKLNKYGEWELYVWVYDPNHEEDIIEKVLSGIVPLIKTCSLLPHSAKGAYRQMPEEGISVEEYEQRLDSIGSIDWSEFGNSDGMDTKYCDADTCVVPGMGG
jgi:ribonucleoside-triphosphate reductase